MKIAPLQERVSFEERKIIRDEIGNESSCWVALFSRWCSCRLLSASEGESGPVVRDGRKVRFTLRYDRSVFLLDSLKTRLIFRGQGYNIDVIDGDTAPKELIYIDATKEDSDDKD